MAAIDLPNVRLQILNRYFGVTNSGPGWISYLSSYSGSEVLSHGQCAGKRGQHDQG